MIWPVTMSEVWHHPGTFTVHWLHNIDCFLRTIMIQSFGQSQHVRHNIKAGVTVKMYRKTLYSFLLKIKTIKTIILQKEKYKPLLNSADESFAYYLINPKKSTSFLQPTLILKLIKTFIRVAAEGRAGVQVDATVCVHRNHRAEAAVYGHHAAFTVTAPAAVVILNHHHLSRVSCWKTQTKSFLHTLTETAASSPLSHFKEKGWHSVFCFFSF